MGQFRTPIHTLADLLTPNQFELGLLTQGQPETWRELKAAVAKIQAIRSARLVVTGCHLADTPEGSLENIVFEDNMPMRLASPRLPIVPVGTGDLFTGLLTANLAHGRNLVGAARNAAAVVLDILGRTIAEGEHEMQLGSVSDALIKTPENDDQ